VKDKLLLNNWKLKSSKELSVGGEKITSVNFKSDEWLDAVVPGTVVASLVKNGVLKDPYYDKNILEMPGYKHGKNTLFSNHYMPDDSPFRKSWWYRTEFILPNNFENKNLFIEFKGINYKADIWINRKRIASFSEVAGSYNRYRFDISDKVNFDKKNILAVEVFAPQPDDLAITFVDWNPVPPDDSMGLWQPVEIGCYDTISLKNTFVKSEISEDRKKADLTIITEVSNSSSEDKEFSLNGEIKKENYFVQFNKKLLIPAKTTLELALNSEEFKELEILNPDLWWPYHMGAQNLYTLKLAAKSCCEKENYSHEEITFGIRKIESHLNEFEARTFKINGEEIQLRGAGWTVDLLLRHSKNQDEIDINYLKNMNFNTVRLEGKLATDYFWDLCNKEGILVIAGWPCCNHWEKWEDWKKDDLSVSLKSLKSQLIRLRKNPSFAAWFYGSDFPPPFEIEREYLKIIDETKVDIPMVSSAADKESKITGKPGVKMSGPYNYVPPQYWYDDEMPGKAERFNTETGSDMCLPDYDSLKKFLSDEELSIGSKGWNLHAGLSEFCNTEFIDKVIKGRFSNYENDLKDVKKYIRVSHFLGYISWRAMFESHLVNWPEATGVIGWMLNSSWPSIIWQLYDYYNLPNGAFYGSKKGCELLHLIYNYNDKNIYLSNHSYDEKKALKSEIYLYDSNFNKIFEKEIFVEKIDKLSNLKIENLIDKIELLKNDGGLLFLTLKDSNNEIISKNDYCFIAGEDIYDMENTRIWYSKPLKEFGNYNFIIENEDNTNLLKAEILESINENDENISLNVRLENNGDKPKIFNQIKLYTKSNKRISPIYMNDNFVSLREKETAHIKVHILLKELSEELREDILKGDINIQIEPLSF